MQIKEAKIFQFGKLNQREIRFAPGINVVYGENEAGKTTLHAFLLAMFFGMEKGRSRQDAYLRYEPWHAPSYYCGALRFEVDGKPFYLERNFYHRDKRELLRNETDGEELSVAYGDLNMLLGGMSKELFLSTYDIPQSGAVTGKELAGILTEYLTAAAEGGEGSLYVGRALQQLDKQKKELNQELKTIQQEKQQQQQALQMKQELLHRDLDGLRVEIEKQERQQEVCREAYDDEVKQAGENPPVGEEQPDGKKLPARKISGERLMSFAALLFAILFVANGAWGVISHGINAFFLGREAVLGIIAGICMAAAWRRRHATTAQHGQNRQPRESCEQMGQPGQSCGQMGQPGQSRGQSIDEESVQIAAGILAHLREQQSEKETQLYNVAEELEALSGAGEKERALRQDIDALELAAETIERLAKDFCEELQDGLNSEVSRYISRFTEGRYDSVRVDEKGKLLVQTEEKEVPPEALSRGTLEQFYLAFRLAVGDIVAKEEPMPVFCDEAFGMYDDKRLAQTLRVLSGLGRQVVIFTCQHREMQMLEEYQIPYTQINLV